MAKSPKPALTDPEISRLAREMARDIKELPEILAQFKLDADQFDVVANNGFFQQRLNEEIQLWNASDPLSINKRIEVKASTMIEDLLLEAYALICDRAQPMQAKVEMLKWIARLAGLGENRPAGDGSGGVKITINLGQQALQFDKEKKLPERVIDGTVVDLTPSNA